jgi:hypothetical protein
VTGIATTTSVAVGDNHACAARAGGTLVWWRSNGSARLGNGTTVDSPTSVAVVGIP